MIKKDLEDIYKKIVEMENFLKEQGIHSILYGSHTGLLVNIFDDEAKNYIKDIKDWDETIEDELETFKHIYTHTLKDKKIMIRNFRKTKKVDSDESEIDK